MRIAYFTETLPQSPTDGVTRTLARLVDTLLTDGIEFRFISASQPHPALSWRDRVHPVPSVPFLPYPYYRLGLPFAGALDHVVDRFAPDLVHVVSPTFLGMYGVQYARGRGLPVVAGFHTDFVSYFRFYGVGALAELGWKYLAWFYNQCDMTYAPAPSVAAALRARGIGPIEVWGRGIDAARFTPTFRSDALRERVGATDVPLLLFVGRLVREKNLDILAGAAKRLERAGRPFRLAFVGEGPLLAELRRRLPHAHFAGWQHGEDLARWYASADLFVFPSTTETFGNVVLEGFASGLPAIVADAGGVRDLVTHDVNGRLAVPDSVDDFTAQLEALLARPSEISRLRCGALETAARYRGTEVNHRLVESYQRIVARRRGPRPNLLSA